MNGKQLKNSILQWAIQGKLVPQDPNDEPASVLLERIREEKARLVKEGKIKKDKNESIIFRGDDNSHYEKFLATGDIKCIDDEIPFEIPEGWEWCRLKDMCSICTGATFKKDDATQSQRGTRILRGGNILPFQVKLKDDDIFIPSNLVKENILLKQNDIVTPAVTSLENIGKMARIEADMLNTTVGGFVFILRPYYNNDTLSQYMLFVMSAPPTVEYMRSITNKSGQAFYNIGKERLATTLIPLPPYAEQRRIALTMSKTLPQVEKYAKHQTDLDRLNTNITVSLKKSILQEAIQGKLVPQDPNDEPASVLLERIREEKLRLLKEGKLKKKDITDSVIFKGEDNKYYEQIGSEVYEIETEMQFPATWELVRLGDICRLVDGEKRSGAYPCLDAKYLRGKSAATILQSGKFVQVGDNIILVDGENSGEVFSVPVDGYMGSTFKQLWISSELHLPYILHFILFYKEQLRNSKKGAAIPHLNKEIFYNLPVGIPPLKEQQKLSESVNILFSKLR